MKKTIRLLSIILFSQQLIACSWLWTGTGHHRKQASSPLLTYLSGGKKIKIDSAITPHLELPLRVGLAFVPSQGGYGTVSAKTQVALLDQLKEGFTEHQFVDEIVIIPSSYLGRQGGFDTIRQAANYYQVDLIALVSYEQILNARDTKAALFYLTILGGYVVPGTENTVQTFIDTAVIDPKSKKILFSAPGIHSMDKHSTAVSVNKTIEKLSEVSFEAAVDQMADNLADSLDAFRTRVKEEQVATVSYRPGHGGGGAGGPILGLFAILLWIAARRYRTEFVQNKRAVELSTAKQDLDRSDKNARF